MPGATPGSPELSPRPIRPPLSLAAIAAGILLACLLTAAAITDPPVSPTLAIGAAGALIMLLASSPKPWELSLHAAAAVLLIIVAGWAEDRIW